MAAVLTETLPAEPEAAHRARPAVIQGGMGVAVSGWRLAREVSRAGHLGVVSGTAMDAVIARRLQDGDPGGHYRRALAHFPAPGHGAARHRHLLRRGWPPAPTPPTSRCPS